MPIYAYRCEDCGYTRDILQKLSDAPLKTCPSCGKDAFRKLVTAASVQSKGSSNASVPSPCSCCCAAGPGGTPCA
ncbi:MAG: zinc ribbon domain-containing protein [Oxalobacter sp.]|nr:zinc ribbon domain-containing protein [Oxalobacter sp.]